MHLELGFANGALNTKFLGMHNLGKDGYDITIEEV